MDLTYREFDHCSLDVIRHDAESILIPKRLPSEPPEGIVYHFNATGYLTRGRNPDYCVIHSEWRNVNNYCHWTLSEIPLIHLALESESENVVISDVLLNADRPFQVRWWEVLRRRFADKNILPLSKLPGQTKGVIPINHDTSTNRSLIGKCEYRHYHHGRATPYCLRMHAELVNDFSSDASLDIPKFYIVRSNPKRRLKNESAVKAFLMDQGFQMICLEDYSLDQQAQLFSNAKCVAGIHGAGLANLVFSTRKTSVLEICDRDSMHPCYMDGFVLPGRKATRTYFHMIAHMKDMNYSCIESKDYCLDPQVLKDALTELNIARA